MEDPRTKAALDALADLFLTGTAPAVGGASLRSAPPYPVSEAQLNGPRPIRLSPKLRAAQQQQTIARELTEQAPTGEGISLRPGEDRPAGVTSAKGPAPTSDGPTLRLHRTDAPASPSDGRGPSRHDARPSELHVEAVFLGNLPGFGGPWLTQYAHHLAQRRGPVGILHVDDERIDVDLVTAGRPPLPQDIADPAAAAEHSLESWAERAPRSSLAELVEALVRRAPVAVVNWLIHLPANLSPTTRPIAQGLKRWTLLCGADEAAVAAGNRLFKSLLGSDPARDQRRLGSMIVGADEARSFQSADRLRAGASSAGLGTIEMVGWQKQMVPVNLTTLASFPDAAGVWAKLWPSLSAQAGIDESLPPVQPLGADAPAVNRGPTDDTVRQPASRDALEGDELEDSPSNDSRSDSGAAAADADADSTLAEEPAWVEQGRELDEELLDDEAADEVEEAEEVAAPPPKLKPQPPAPPGEKRRAAGTAAATEGAAGEPDLAAYVAGLVALRAHSPKHPHTQLALDEDGVVHLLRRHAGEAKGDPAAALRTAVVDLIEARAWVREHAELLAMTQRQLRFDSGAEPVLHLFTGEAKLATALAARLGEFVRLHLLKRVTIGAASTWFSTELN